jgi:hypothetical protein
LNSQNHTQSTRQLNNLYHPITNLTVCQRGIHYIGIRIFNNLPPYIKDISNNIKKSENCLKRFLHIFLLFPRRILSTQILYKLKMFLTSQPIVILRSVKCVICVLCFTHYKCWHSYLTRSSVTMIIILCL